MYFDLIILLAIIILVSTFFKRLSNFIFIIVIIDIFLKILSFIADNVFIPNLQMFLIKYFPASVSALITRYTSGPITTFVNWLIVIIYVMFLYYIVKIFFKKKRI